MKDCVQDLEAIFCTSHSDSFLFLFNHFFLKCNGACIDLTISFTYTVTFEHMVNYAVHYIKPGLSSPPKFPVKFCLTSV